MKMKKAGILSLLLAVMLIVPLFSAFAAGDVPADRLSGLTHNAPHTGIMMPERFDPYQTTYLLTVASWVSRVKLTPTCSSPDSVITVNGQVVKSGQPSPIIQMTNEPQAATITVSSYNGSRQLVGQTTYTVYLQRRPSERRTRVSAGYISDIFLKDGACTISADLVTLKYQGISNVSTFTNDSNYVYKDYRCADNCLYYYGTLNNPVRARNAEEFISHYNANGSTLYYLIYIEDKIVAVMPYGEG